MICVRCHHTHPVSRATVHRCPKCGSTYHVSDRGDPTIITPPLLPVCDSGVLSPWIDSRYHPYRTGVFECEFRDGIRLRLRWSGYAWTWCGLIVDTTPLLKWRGKWARA